MKPFAFAAASLAVGPLLALAPPFGSPFYSAIGPWPKTGKGQGHGRPGTRSKAERNARKAKRRQRAKARR